MTNPAAKTKSIGLPADALAVMVFAKPSGEFYRDRTTRGRLSGVTHLDNFIVTRKSCSSTGTKQKLMPALTWTATNPTTGPLGFIAIEKQIICYLDN
jgi:hypothetical protein